MSDDTVKLKRLEVFFKHSRADRVKADESATKARKIEEQAARELYDHVTKMRKNPA